MTERELVFKKWKEALLSGEYKQTKHGLKDEVGHCCLGVLCEVVGLKEGRNLTKKVFGFPVGPSVLEPSSGHLPAGLCELLGMSYAGRLKGGIRLSDLNDGGMPFKEIAEHIDNLDLMKPEPVTDVYGYIFKLEGGKVVRS